MDTMIEIKNLVKKYGTFTAVDDVSFAVPKGEVFALLGPNGCGKTTILRVMMGLLKRKAGTIKIGGEDVEKKSVEIRRKISYLPQQVVFPENLTGEEILRFYCRLRNMKMEGIDQVFSLKGMRDFLSRPVGEYSGGMQQRLALAITLLPRSEILIMDEPTASLDPEAVYEFRQTIRELCRQGTTVVLATHLLSESEGLADRVAIMQTGKIISLKSMKEMKEEILSSFKFYISLGHMEERFATVAEANGASEVECVDRVLIMATEKPEDRFRILNAMREAGGSIERFGTIEPPLEEVYMKILQDREG